MLRLMMLLILCFMPGLPVLLSQAVAPEQWYEFKPSAVSDAGVIGMSHWLDAPAGKHGFVQIDGEALVFEDETPIKFWGTNICSQLPFVEKSTADRFVRFLAYYGINVVRFHKFSRHAYDGDHSTRLDPKKFNRFDYFQAKLRQQGIYYGWSHIYGHRVQPADSSKLIVYSEIANLKYRWSHLNGSTFGLVNFAPDLQDLHIELTVNMLNHVNPYTGLRYADDPALAFIEFQNEDNLFWASVEKALDQAPSYRALLCRLFTRWLKEKYGSHDALVAAWGKKNIPRGQTMAKQNLYPQPNHGVFDWEYKSAIRENRALPQHHLDKMRFLYETQNAFYQRFKAAVRATGYRGVLVASCWQAGSGVSHFYNLHSDYQIGMIDRHNYFGGGAGRHRVKTGPVKNRSMLDRPGSGLLSSGMQQVVDRPFSLSEWMSLIPNQWTAEAAPVVAAYGMGLQGWDASFSFATDLPRFSRYLESESHGVYNATSPLHIGLYPVLARMVYRGDVSQSPVLAGRNVHVASLHKGKLGFDEWLEQEYDDKQFNGTIPSKTLAIGRIPVRFTEAFIPTVLPNLTTFTDDSAKVVRSVTGELNWHYGDQPFITINTDATKGIVGFVAGRQVVLDDWTFLVSNPFAVVFVTALSRNKTLRESDDIFIATVAQARNSGMRYSAKGDTLYTSGNAPLLLQAVGVKIEHPALADYSIQVLDHSGLPTDRRVPIRRNSAILDGASYKTLYYLMKKGSTKK